MRKMNKLVAIVMLAVVATLGTQTTFANTGIILGDRQANGTKDVRTPDVLGILLVYIKTGVLLSDRSGVILSD